MFVSSRITDPGAKNYRRNADCWVGFSLMRLSVFALQLGRGWGPQGSGGSGGNGAGIKIYALRAWKFSSVVCWGLFLTILLPAFYTFYHRVYVSRRRPFSIEARPCLLPGGRMGQARKTYASPRRSVPAPLCASPGPSLLSSG